MTRRALAALLACGQLSCATVTNGLRQDVTVTSRPPGARVLVDGHPVGETPCTASLRRGRLHTITLESEGFLTEEIPIVRTMSWWFTGNLVLTIAPVPGSGLLSMIVDLATGSVANVEPRELDVDLVKVVPPEAGLTGPRDPSWTNEGPGLDNQPELEHVLETPRPGAGGRP